ncbi:hypothetical protein CEXT_285821 [Caerostris extrusa]|uniref:Uncharacterized protein n=1 Tax=Caerostris extrusa TaxID=172846 RepID=A0AAV4UZT4_CAEEX|nr:hypothetical protein CEXT_285821 [Caerostris extrusa]
MTSRMDARGAMVASNERGFMGRLHDVKNYLRGHVPDEKDPANPWPDARSHEPCTSQSLRKPYYSGTVEMKTNRFPLQLREKAPCSTSLRNGPSHISTTLAQSLDTAKTTLFGDINDILRYCSGPTDRPDGRTMTGGLYRLPLPVCQEGVEGMIPPLALPLEYLLVYCRRLEATPAITSGGLERRNELCEKIIGVEMATEDEDVPMMDGDRFEQMLINSPPLPL